MSTERPLELPSVLGAQIAFSDLELDPEHETGLNVYGRHRLMQGLSSVGKQIAHLFHAQNPLPRKIGDLMVVRVFIFAVGEDEYYALQRAKVSLQQAVKEGRAKNTRAALSKELEHELSQVNDPRSNG